MELKIIDRLYIFSFPSLFRYRIGKGGEPVSFRRKYEIKSDVYSYIRLYTYKEIFK